MARAKQAVTSYWIVMTIQGWSDVKLFSHGIEFPARIDAPVDDNEPTHFIPAFLTREAAERWRGERRHLPIREVVAIEQD